MDAASHRQQATARLIHHGVSDTLLAFFAGLTDQSDATGRPRHPKAAIAELRQALLCRNYAGLTLELAWLARALSGTGPFNGTALLTLFYVESATTRQRFEQAVAAGSLALPPGTDLTDGQLKTSDDSQHFAVHLHRLPSLACLVELLVWIEPGLFSKRSEQAVQPGPLANQWQQQLYAWLGEHLQPLHQQRRFLALLDWLLARQPDRTPEHTIDDEGILAYWLAPSDGDAVRFRTVAECFLYLKQALDIGATRIEADHAQCLVDLFDSQWPDHDAMAELDQQLPPVESLTRHPKFLTAANAARLDPLARFGPWLPRFALTLSRMRVWGDQQSRCIEAAKRGQPLTDDPDSDYAGWLATLADIEAALMQAELASIQALLSLGEAGEALGALAERDPQAFVELKNTDVNLDSLHDGAGLARLRLASPAFNAAWGEVEQSWKKINRAGFRNTEDLAEADVYLAGLSYLRQLRRWSDGLRQALDRPEEKFRADLPIFSRRLEQLHSPD